MVFAVILKFDTLVNPNYRLKQSHFNFGCERKYKKIKAYF
ncbi:hypothetical protein VCHA47P369_30154 [Vibrio chagasii]|nr:hypothetical protein VCHA48P435_10375 [Vibrio chagasii]CAH7089754.1 hypothetical protein VCHA51O448_10432 [Vibrio chagasii]CAH7143021.1 hypothetical protein VCHA47P369_30154 [Vibrio chagasii]